MLTQSVISSFEMFLRVSKESYCAFLSFVTFKCCYSVGYSLNDAKASHNEVHAFGSESYRLFKLALHAMFLRWINS